MFLNIKKTETMVIPKKGTTPKIVYQNARPSQIQIFGGNHNINEDGQ